MAAWQMFESCAKSLNNTRALCKSVAQTSQTNTGILQSYTGALMKHGKFSITHGHSLIKHWHCAITPGHFAIKHGHALHSNTRMRTNHRFSASWLKVAPTLDKSTSPWPTTAYFEA